MGLLLCAMSCVFHQPNRVLEEMKTKFSKSSQENHIKNNFIDSTNSPEELTRLHGLHRFITNLPNINRTLADGVYKIYSNNVFKNISNQGKILNSVSECFKRYPLIDLFLLFYTFANNDSNTNAE